MAEGTHVTVWFGKNDQDLLAILKQPGLNASGLIKMALRAHVEGDKPTMIAKAVVDELSSCGLFLSPGEQQDDEVDNILSSAVQQFTNTEGGTNGSR